MCGIAFFVNYDPKKKIDLDLVKETFINLESRGKDASGFYWERKSKDGMDGRTIKSPEPATDFWDHVHAKNHSGKNKELFNKYKLNGHERLIMLHTRAKTRGSQYDNNNNMPIYSKNYILVHNGVISSPRIEGYDYIGDVDSEEILARIERNGIIDGLKKVAGSMAVAFKKFDEDFLYFGRRTNPLQLVYLTNRKILIGISDGDYVELPDEEYEINRMVFESSNSVTNLPQDYLYKVSLIEPKLEEVGKIDHDYGSSYRKTGPNSWEYTGVED